MNKKALLLLCAFFLLITPQMLSQVFLGGSLSANSENREVFNTLKVKQKTLTLKPQIGYFINDKSVVGIELNLITVTTSNTNLRVGKYEGDGYGLGLFFRRYKPINERVKLYLHSTAGFISSSYDYYMSNFDDGSVINMTSKSKEFNLTLSPGISCKITDKINLAFSIGNVVFTNQKRDSSSNISSRDFKITGNSFGFSWNNISTGLYFKL